jgi:hypothetical protein
LPFDEYALLTELRPYLQRELGFNTIDVVTQDEARQRAEGPSGTEPGWTKQLIEQAEPLKPSFEFLCVREAYLIHAADAARSNV